MMSDGSQGGPPPGWYADATRADRLRWWNGTAWTDQFRTRGADAAASPQTDAAGSSETDAAPSPETDAAAPRLEAATPAAPTSRAELRASPRRATELTDDGESVASGARSAVDDVDRPVSTTPAEAEPEADSPFSVHVWPAPSSLAADASPGQSPAMASSSATPSEPPATEPIQAVPAAADEPASEQQRAASEREREAERTADQIPPRRRASPQDRPPAPIVYQPVSSSYVGEMRPPLPEAAAGNVPARASIVLILIAAAGGIAVVAWLANRDHVLAGMVGLVSVALAAGAFFLAIGGLITAAQRRTSRVMSAVALVASVALVAWLVLVAAGQALAILA